MVDFAGRPVPNAEVSAKPSEEPTDLNRPEVARPARAAKNTVMATTGSGGFFRLPVPAAGIEYAMQAEADGYMRSYKKEVVPEEGLQDLRFVLKTGCMVSGKVLDSAGMPMGNIVVLAHTGCQISEEFVAVTLDITNSKPTGADGAYQLIGLKPGLCLFGAEQEGKTLISPDFSEALLSLELQPDKHHTNVDLVLPTQPECTIEGKVTDPDGRPIEGVTISAGYGEEARTGNKPMPVAPTDQDGRFQVFFVERRGW